MNQQPEKIKYQGERAVKEEEEEKGENLRKKQIEYLKMRFLTVDHQRIQSIRTFSSCSKESTAQT